MKSETLEIVKQLTLIECPNNHGIPCDYCKHCGPPCLECVANFILADRKRICEPLVKAVEESDRIGSNESTVPAWQRLDKAVYETLKLAGIAEDGK